MKGNFCDMENHFAFRGRKEEVKEIEELVNEERLTEGALSKL